jgi:sigma-B regulation protein RsbU (phosphoserine phosphatase)
VAYGAPQRPIVVGSSIEDTTFTITVANEGPAIAAELLPRLFDPMTRGSPAEGTHSVGLGLFIVREIARAHRGAVTVESAHGTTQFTVTLPRGRDAPA